MLEAYDPAMIRNVEHLLFIVYLLAGPLAWAFFVFSITIGRHKMMLLKPGRKLPANPPKVTVLVPAKDEGQRIRSCLQSILDQNYPDFNLIAIDDRSTDETGKVMDEMAETNPRMQVLHIQDGTLGEGWTGKNNALWTGAKYAQGAWLCFVDSDVLLEPDALHQTVSIAEGRHYDLVTLLPRLECHTIWESTVIPLAGAAASAMYLIALSNNNRLKKIAFANGQYLLIRRTAYDAFGGHEAVKDRYCEDVEIAHLVKQLGFRPRVSWGNAVCSVRMYSSLKSIIRGWSRIYYAARVGSPWRTLAALSFVVICCFSWFAAMAYGLLRVSDVGLTGERWLTAATVHVGIMLAGLGCIYRWSGNSPLNALSFPVSLVILVIIQIKAIVMCYTKKVEWRGTSYQHQMRQKSSAPF